MGRVLRGPLWIRTASFVLLYFVVVLAARATLEAFFRDPRTSPFVTFSDVLWSTRLIGTWLIVMGLRSAFLFLRNRRRG